MNTYYEFTTEELMDINANGSIRIEGGISWIYNPAPNPTPQPSC